MGASTRPLAVAAISLICVSGATSSVAAASRVHGVVADASGGVLPGVTVVATDDDGNVLATGVTDGVGAYTLAGLPAGHLTITYELDGFAHEVAAFTLYDLSVDVVVNRRLAIATQSEVVTVYGNVPADPPAPEPPAPTPPSIVALPPHDRDSICGPSKLSVVAAESLGTIKARRNAPEYELYAQGDELDIAGGMANGLDVGRYLAVRRSYRAGGSRRTVNAEHTAGLIQIVEAQERSSTAVVVFACDELRRGDRLAAFTPQPTPSSEPTGAPDFQNAARVLFADAGQTIGVPWRLMVIDRGRDSGLRVGQRLTLFRRGSKDDPVIVGHAVIVATRADSATIRVDQATDPIASGDWAAPERRAQPALAPDNAPARRHP